jgi:hypothetical protein
MYLNMLQRPLKKARRDRVAGLSPLDEGLGITIRFAYPDDATALRRLASLDSKLLPSGQLLIAEVAGEVWAAVSVTGEGQAIADPFRHTAELVSLLHDRAHRLTRPLQRPPTAQPGRRRPAYE